jgi:hypothetical protein
VVWFNDKGTSNKNGEVMFKASTDSGKTFGNKTNLSNTPNVDSIDAEISAAGNNVYVTWWERANKTSNEPVMTISTDIKIKERLHIVSLDHCVTNHCSCCCLLLLWLLSLFQPKKLSTHR